MSYDPLASFEPICRLVISPTVYSVNSASSYRTLTDLLDAARAKPGTLTLAGSGPASPFQIGFEVLKRAANVNMTFVPFPGGAPAINALLGGHVTAMFGTYSTASEHVKAGKLRALATASRTRLEALPDVPTVDELGFRDYEVDLWYGSSRAGADAEGIHLATCRLAHRRDAGPRGARKTCRAGARPGHNVRRRFRRAPAHAIR